MAAETSDGAKKQHDEHRPWPPLNERDSRYHLASRRPCLIYQIPMVSSNQRGMVAGPGGPSGDGSLEGRLGPVSRFDPRHRALFFLFYHDGLSAGGLVDQALPPVLRRGTGHTAPAIARSLRVLMTPRSGLRSMITSTRTVSGWVESR